MFTPIPNGHYTVLSNSKIFQTNTKKGNEVCLSIGCKVFEAGAGHIYALVLQHLKLSE